MTSTSISLALAKSFLGQEVEVTIDRPLGSLHPKHGFLYEVNYGFLKGVRSPDGEDLDAYVLGIDKPLESFSGTVTAIIHRLEDDDDKLVVTPSGTNLTIEEIDQAVHFQEQWFEHEVIQ